MLIPIGYVIATRCQGDRIRAMLIGLALQLLWSVGVYLLVRYNRIAGYREWYYANLFYIPVNIVGLVYYFIALAWKSDHKASHEQNSELNNPLDRKNAL